jgi:formylglycine-generating enzyme required for sulfatase activity
MTCTDVAVTAASGSVYDCEGWRLPTEAEWEHAARGGESYAYAGSNTLEDVGWYSGNSGYETHEVCTLAANGYGLCDLSGNVWEWTWDWYDDYGGDATDPEGAASGSYRVYRGGSWSYVPVVARVADRLGDGPGNRYDALGLRLLRSVP